jgi:pyridoxal phosphate enzyme (YggS family)
MQSVDDNLAKVDEQITAACARVGRARSEVRLVAVSKTHPAETIREAIAAGCAIFGENKVQEAEAKILEIGRDAAEWHLIGHLQSNKARKAVQLFDIIQSLDSVELATRLERISVEEGRASLPVLVQVDLAGEETKSGISERDLPALVQYLQECESLKFVGLMILPPLSELPETTRPYFRRLREIRDELAAQHSFAYGRGELSMGMSHDFKVAIEEGATLLRVGTAIFGERHTAETRPFGSVQHQR